MKIDPLERELFFHLPGDIVTWYSRRYRKQIQGKVLKCSLKIRKHRGEFKSIKRISVLVPPGKDGYDLCYYGVTSISPESVKPAQ